jgi:seryl-tRNA synthetase
MGNSKSKKLTLTAEEALKKQKELVEECKDLGVKFASKLDNTTWEQLERAEAKLNTIHLALLNLNETKANNSRIKERELLIRRLDVLNKANKSIDRKRTKLGNLFNTWFNKLKGIVNIPPLIKEIQNRIDNLTGELVEFNKTNFITVELA